VNSQDLPFIGFTTTYVRAAQTEERLSALTFININYKMEIDIDSVCKLYLDKYARMCQFCLPPCHKKTEKNGKDQNMPELQQTCVCLCAVFLFMLFILCDST